MGIQPPRGLRPVGFALRERVNLLHDPPPVALQQLDDMAFGVTVGIGKLIRARDRGVRKKLSKHGDARDKRGAVVLRR